MLSPRSLLALIAGLVVGGLLLFFLLRGSREEPGVPDTASMVGAVTPDPDPRLLTDDGEPANDAGAVSGRSPLDPGTLPVVEPKLRGEVLDEDGRPVGGARVTVRRIDAQSLRGAPFPDGPALNGTTTDRNGDFEMEAPFEGWLRVTASADGRATVSERVASTGAFVRIVLPRAATLVVYVAGEGMRPVNAAWVEAQVGQTRVRVDTLRRDGAAVFTPPARAASIRAGATSRGIVRAGPVALTTKAETIVAVEIPRGRALAGIVVDAETDAPIANAEVHVARPGESSDAGVTNAKGWFDPIHAGGVGQRVFVAVRAAGYAPALAPVVLDDADDEHQTVQVALRPSVDWTGQVVASNGRPVEGARVFYGADGIAGRAAERTETDAAGQFRIAPPPPPAPGRRVILMAESEQGSAALALRPHQPQPQPLVLQLSRGFVVTGRVVDAEGDAVAGAVVRAVPAWDRVSSRHAPTPAASKLYAANERGFVGLSTGTNEQGAFALRNVPDGPFEIVVRVRGQDRRPDLRFDVNGSNVDLGVVELGTGLRVEGVVTDPHGEPVAGATVRVLQSGARVRSISVTTDARGAYLVEDLAPGSYRLVASLPGYTNGTVSFELTKHRFEDVALAFAGRIDVSLTMDGEPYRGGSARVMLERVGSSSAATPRSLRVIQGGVEIDDVAEGVWRVRVQAGDLQGSSSELSIGPGDRATTGIALVKSATVSGRVLTGDGAPVEGARLVLVQDRGSRHVATGRTDGTFRFTGLEPGDYRLRATARKGAPIEERVTLNAGKNTTIDVTLPEGGSVRVTIVDEDGRRQRGAVLLFRNELGALPVSPPDRTGRDGVALRSNLPEGEVEISARAGDLRGYGRAHVIKGRTQEVEIVVRSTGG